jgi:hypothetical protein
MKIGKIDSTHHGSNGWREFISDNLRSGDSFEVTFEVNGSLVADVYDVWNLGAAVACVFTEAGLPAWSFNALLTEFDLGKADASKPDEEQVVITMQPTAAISLAAAAGNWYDNVVAMYLDTGAVTIAAGHTQQIHVYAVAPGLPPFEVPDYSDLTMADDGAGAKATISAAGLLTGVSAGSADITFTITANANVNVGLEVTVTA